MLNGKSNLVTGGTGSFGQAFARAVLDRFPDIRRLVVFSRDELKQFEMEQGFPRESRLRFFIGDVRDRDRMKRAFHDVDFVIHVFHDEEREYYALERLWADAPVVDWDARAASSG
jgi:UDP-N-acetylglucosamine 4,6-dehydratase/5-epimerase